MHGFMALIERLAARDRARWRCTSRSITCCSGSGLIEHYKRDKADRGEARVENLDELVSAARGFTPEGADGELPPLEAFLAHAALESGEGQADAWEDCVQMMTLHTAKGLEFPVVFLCRHGGRPVPAPALAATISMASRRSAACVMSA